MKEMRDKSHEEQIERWAEFVMKNPRSVWKPHLNRFINAQIEKANEFYAKLSKTEEGRRAIQRIREMKIKKDLMR